MPRFFNRIRRQLAKENRFFQYSRYAIGEILLVVIGILIALQIDNWNEKRKERNLYRNYLVRLKSDFENFYRAAEHHSWWEEELRDLAVFQADFLNGQLESLDTLKLAVSIEFTGAINFYSIDLPTSSELSSTGRFTLIENDSLKTVLNNWNGIQVQRKDENEEWYAWIYKYRELVRNILTTEDKLDIDFMWNRPYPDDSRWKTYKLRTAGRLITKELSEIPEFPGLLNDIIVARSITLGHLNHEKRMASETIELIQSEIDRLNN